MNTTMFKTISLILTAAILVACVGIYVSTSKTGKAPALRTGSVVDVYQASTTDSTLAGRSQKFKGSTTAASSTPTAGVFGSFVITGTSATVIEVKDATSTTDLSSTSLATFAASTAAGTYTFDAAFTRGLIINFLGAYAGNGTVTYR